MPAVHRSREVALTPRHDGAADVTRAASRLAHRLPGPLRPYAELAYNYWWSWQGAPDEPFEVFDAGRWARAGRNPVRFLNELPEDRLLAAASNGSIVAEGERLVAALGDDLARPPVEPTSADAPIVFLSAEYAVHASLPIYSGGLGVLAGDILKESSDLALPLFAVGLLYRQGYFHQRLDLSGWQHEYWVETDPDMLPAALVTGEDNRPLTVQVPVYGRDITVQLWRVDVGRVPLLLLDADRPENRPLDRWITARLYVGDRRTRLAQYVILGIGAMRALRAMGVEPSVVHLNEGHAAFAALEQLGDAARHTPFAEALERARSRTVFTTHTPVAAGNEGFAPAELAEMLDDLPERYGLDRADLMPLGRGPGEGDEASFGLTPFCIRTARSVNGVSARHGEVSRAMWAHLFPDTDVPITSVTNGVHLPTWMAPAMRSLLDTYLGAGWHARASDPATWAGVDDIPDAELWRVRRELRAQLVDYARERSTFDRLDRGETWEYAEAAANGLNPDALTLGFARRVATYKRLPLLVHDPDRALRIIGGEAPVQLLMAGKAHPSDDEAKGTLRHVFGMKGGPRVSERIAYLEDYGTVMASHLVAGCDVWVNLPRAPLEASGTSGMKSMLNGGLNLSVLDGWWAEAYEPGVGWAIPGDTPDDPGEQDARDAASFYDLLETEVLPAFYDRGPDGVPARWVAMVKRTLRTNGPRFCATRMMREYLERIYPA